MVDVFYPGDLPFSFCLASPVGDNEATKMCVESIPAQVDAEYQCDGGTKQMSVSTEISYAQVKVSTDEGSITYDYTFWIGIDYDGCVWWGVENLNICEKADCQTPSGNLFLTTVEIMMALVWSIGETIFDGLQIEFPDNTPADGTIGADVYIAFVSAGVVLLLLKAGTPA